MDTIDRRTMFQALTAMSGAMLAAPSVAQPAKAATLRFVPQANLTALDPIWTSAIVTADSSFVANTSVALKGLRWCDGGSETWADGG